MPRAISLQTSFNSGVIDPRLHARSDIRHFYQGAETGTNVLAIPQGGLKRRPGLAYVDDIGETGRLAAFAFNTEQTYLLVFTDANVAIYKDDVWQADVTTPWSAADLTDLRWTQSADTMILVHPDYQPRSLVRGASHSSWTLSAITLSNIPTYDFGSGAESVLSATRGWPVSVTFHEGRLWFGGSKSKPQSLFGSKTNDFYNFDLGTGLDDEAIFVTLDTDQVNAITAVFSGRHLQVFTTGGEFYLPDSPITPSASSVKRQTLFGALRVPPVSVDGATLFLDRTGKAVREFLFTYVEEAYNAASVSLLASHLISSPVAMAAARGSSNDDANFVYFVNGDGTVAVFNTLRAQEIAAWTPWETSGDFLDVAVVVDDVYFLVKRTINSTTEYYLEKLDADTYTDANKKQTISPSTTVTGLSHLNGEECRVRADGAVMANATPSGGEITLEREGTEVEVGLEFDVTIKTLPLNMDFQDGPTLTRKKRITRCWLDLYESLGVYVNGKYLPDRKFGSDLLDQTPDPFTGRKDVWLLGWDEYAQVTITQQDPLPFTLRALGIEVEA